MPILHKLSHWGRDRRTGTGADKLEHTSDQNEQHAKQMDAKSLSNQKVTRSAKLRSRPSKSELVQMPNSATVQREEQLQRKLNKARPPPLQCCEESNQQQPYDPFLESPNYIRLLHSNALTASPDYQQSLLTDLSRNYSLPRRITIVSTKSPRTSAETMSSEHSGVSTETTSTLLSSIMSCQEMLSPNTQRRGRSICIRSSVYDEPPQGPIPVAIPAHLPVSQSRSKSMPRSHSRWNSSISLLNAPTPATSYPATPALRQASSISNFSSAAGTFDNNSKLSGYGRPCTAGEPDRSNDSWNQYFEQLPPRSTWSKEPPSPAPTRALPPLPAVPPLQLPRRPSTAHGTYPTGSPRSPSRPKSSTRSRANSSTQPRNSSHTRKRSGSSSAAAAVSYRIFPEIQTLPPPPTLTRSKSVSFAGHSRSQTHPSISTPPLPAFNVAPLRIKSASNMKAEAQSQAQAQLRASNIRTSAPVRYSQYSSANLI